MGTMLKNSWTTVIGLLTGLTTWMSAIGGKWPSTRGEWGAALSALGVALLGVFSKDALTGSKPK